MAFLKIPTSLATVAVSIIDTGSWVYRVPCADLFHPPFKGFKMLNLCSYSFLVTHHSGGKVRRVIFDLGMRKDPENMVPSTVRKWKLWDADFKMKKDVTDVLEEYGTDLASIEGVIWSHLHWDHTGNPTKFPPSVKLLVGPGITKKFMPGWPKVSTAEINEADVSGREVVEITEDKFNVDVGGFSGYDYFGDGSFYLLNAPGHATGHLNALARTSSEPESFILMAADSVHVCGEFRPSEALPLPEKVDEPGLIPCPCPRELLLEMHPRGSAVIPFMGLDPRFPENLTQAEQTIERVQAFDADERVLVIFSHDTTLYDVLEYFPKSANDWRAKGWKMAGRWRFLVDLQTLSNEDQRTSSE